MRAEEEGSDGGEAKSAVREEACKEAGVSFRRGRLAGRREELAEVGIDSGIFSDILGL